MTNNKRIIFVLFLFAIIIRLSYVIAAPQVSLAGSDAKEYDLIVESLLKGGGFPVERLSGNEVEIVRPPLFPLFLAGIYYVFGHNYSAARVIQALLASLLVFIIYYLARDIFKNEAAAVISCFVYALYPSLIAYTGLLYSETVFIFFFMFSMFFLHKAIISSGLGFYALTGLFLGAATMISSRSLYVPVFILPGLLFTPNNKKKAIKGFITIIAVMLIIFLPWTIRNYFVSGGRLILLENYSSSTALWLATNPQGEILEWNYEKEPLKSLVKDLPVSQRTVVIRKEALNNLKRYPWAYARNSFKRFFILLFSGHSNCFFGLEKSIQQLIGEGGTFKAAVKILLLIFNSVFIVFGFWGIWIFRKSWHSAVTILIPIFYIMSLHTFYVAAPRLQMPMIPFLIMFASFALVKTITSFKPGV